MSISELTTKQNAASKQMFKDGESTFEVVNKIVTDDLVVLVMIERNTIRVQGANEDQPWVLQTTQVFPFDQDGRWWRLHRDADRLIHFRPGDGTFALAQEP